MSPRRRPPVAVLLLVGSLYALNLLRFRSSTLDDAYISLRYARNLVEGNGLVFNAGERVEGYTNFLLVLIEAAFMRAGLAADVAVVGVSFAASLWVLWMLRCLQPMVGGAQAKDDRPGLLPAALLLLPLEAFGYWSTGGLETMLFAALLLSGVLALLREHDRGALRGAAPVFVLLALVRPEGVLLFALCHGAILLHDVTRGRPLASLRLVVANALIFSLAYGVYFLWRYDYYGYLLPNTFYAKVAGGGVQLVNGARYLGQWAMAHPLQALALASPFAFISGARTARCSPALFVVYVVVAGHLGYVVWVGGDSMPYFRFVLPVLPLCCLLISWAYATLVDRGAIGAGATTAVAAALLAVNPIASYLDEQAQRAFVAHRTALAGKYVGGWLAERMAPGDLLAVNTAGTVPYYSRAAVVDTLGLNDAAIAHRPVMIVSEGWIGHRRGWGQYVLDRRPRIVLWYNSAGSKTPHYLGDRELADDPFFRFFYSLEQATLHGNVAAGGRSPIARFLGDAFELGEASSAVMPELGVRIERVGRRPAWTRLYEVPIVVNYFEFEQRYLRFWSMRHGFFQDTRGFVDAVADEWSIAQQDRPAAPAALRAEADAMAAAAYARLQAGEPREAKRILRDALARNDTARSPLVYQYAANLAALDGDLLLAVWAQKRALELEPGNALYRSNLASLLTAPFPRARQSGD